MAGEGAGQFGIFAADLTPHQGFEFSILFDEAIDAFVESSVLGIEVFLHLHGQPVVHAARVFAETGVEGGQEAVALAPDLLDVDFAPRLP